MPHINETISEEIGDYCPVFYNAFIGSAQSAKTLQNTLWHTDRKKQFVYEHDRSADLFFNIYGRKQEEIFL